ncbi:hypothetical protein [Streptomyces californicus]|uniref:hypothetical protein n=1 Tax=Streptomyces californicus TaxID=67351 RepID=UPI00379AEDBC
MDKKQTRAVGVCTRAGNRTVKPMWVAHCLGVSTRYVPQSVLPMTGAQVLAAMENPPGWVTEAKAKTHARHQTGQARARRRAAPEPIIWDLPALEAEYTRERLKDGLGYNQARREGKVAARRARDAVGLQNAGELMLAEQAARAQAIADGAGSRQCGPGGAQPPA